MVEDSRLPRAASRRGFPRRMANVAVSLLPWVAALYLHDWLGRTGTWDAATTPLRELMSVGIIGVGMLLSFTAYSRLTRATGPARR
jgi:hypothetical protein